jgi:hypothetical protein
MRWRWTHSNIILHFAYIGTQEHAIHFYRGKLWMGCLSYVSSLFLRLPWACHGCCFLWQRTYVNRTTLLFIWTNVQTQVLVSSSQH